MPQFTEERDFSAKATASEIMPQREQPQIALRAENWWTIEIVTHIAKIRIKLSRGKVDKIEQTEIIKV